VASRRETVEIRRDADLKRGFARILALGCWLLAVGKSSRSVVFRSVGVSLAVEWRPAARLWIFGRDADSKRDLP